MATEIDIANQIRMELKQDTSHRYQIICDRLADLSCHFGWVFASKVATLVDDRIAHFITKIA